ncbi:MAG: hypothetical protein ACR2PL_00220 [Dehalococcoidia bacterium]
MQYEVSINFEGTVNPEAATGEDRTLNLDGSGRPPESGEVWFIRGQVIWPNAEEGRPEQANVEIIGPMNGELRARLKDGAITTITDANGESQASRMDIQLAVYESAGRFEGSQGIIRLFGTVEPQGFLLSANLQLDAPESAWSPPNNRPLTDAEGASGASHIGPQPLSQRTAERTSQNSAQKS